MTEPADITVDDVITVDEEAEVLPFRYSITSYGADYPIDSLVKRLKSGAIFVPPFQRGYVWNAPQASRFIESLLLGLPVPGIFLARESDSGELLVIDGQQRLLTLKYFYGGRFSDDRAFTLSGVQPRFVGLTYDDLPVADRLRLDDSIIHATVIKQDEPSGDQSSIYHVFERLNTGGTPLSPQEIRAAIFHGPFNELLKDLNEDKYWRAIFATRNKRMRDQEMVLRFLAFRFADRDYFEPLKGFLNYFMGSNQLATEAELAKFSKTFRNTIREIHDAVGVRAFRTTRTFNAAVFDSVMVGLSRRLESAGAVDHKELESAYDNLIGDEEFLAAVESRTASRDSVETRMNLAINAFAQV